MLPDISAVPRNGGLGREQTLGSFASTNPRREPSEGAIPSPARQSKGHLCPLQSMLERSGCSEFTMEAATGNVFRVTDTMVGDWVEIPAPILGERLLQYV